MIAKQTHYLTEDRSKAVPEGHKDAKFLLVQKGQEISDADAEKYGITGEKSGKHETEPPEDEPTDRKGKHGK